MEHILLHSIDHAFTDTLHLLPFLFLTYLAMEYMEHKTSSGLQNLLRRSGKFGPVVGGLAGVLPQCGFSAAASGFYAGKVITTGTLIAVYLSTSDEMLPILISERAPMSMILSILAFKAAVGMGIGLLINAGAKRKGSEYQIEDLCEHCHCEKGILRSALFHTLEIAAFIFVFTFIFTIAIELVGEDNLKLLLVELPGIGELLAGLIGLIPNCASSVLLTSLYLDNLISPGCMIAGLLCSAGLGLFVLFKSNRPMKDNFRILGILYTSSVLCGIMVNAFGIVF